MEQVFGVPRSVLESEFGVFQGFLPAAGVLLDVVQRLEGSGEFRLRSDVEEDRCWQQLIPYVALTCRGRVLLLERLATQAERRLHHLLSIGVGGHINPEPEGPDPLVVRGLRREVEEEMEIDLRSSRRPGELPELLGFIRDDSNDVGRVHFGIACRLEIPAPVEVRERDRMLGRWISAEELGVHEERMEGWSQILWPVVRDVVARETELGVRGNAGALPID